MSQRDEKDLFSETTMTFGEHIEELRRCLWKAMIGLLIGFGIGLSVGERIVDFIQSPLKRSLEEYYSNQAKEQLRREYEGKVSPEVLAMVVERGLIPEQMTIEPRFFMQQFIEAHPGLAGVLAFPAYPFRDEDVANAETLAEALVKAGKQRERTGLAGIWDGLTADKQTHLIKGTGSDDDAELLKKREALAKIFDQALSRPDLYDETTFAESMKKHAAKDELIKRFTKRGENNDNAEVRLLNWFALHAELTGDWFDLNAESANPIASPHPLLVRARVWRDLKNDRRIKIKTLSPQEAFVIWLKASLVFGMVISSPWLFWQMWQFVGAGLYPHEKRYVTIFLPFSLVLFWAGAALAFFFVFRFVLDFLFSFNASMGIDPDPRISEWIGFALFLPIGFGISFQLPLVMLFMERIGLFSVEIYIRKVRISILVIAVLSMLLTPADPISMLLMFIPLTLLYFLGVALCKYMPRSRSPFKEVDEV
ncbi:MAG: twin-arginine translocase subunit TatC [Planctomycetes bacterium]|nr:twin-arginine translocase subunit TatC [Planctomycetota bacterium]